MILRPLRAAAVGLALVAAGAAGLSVAVPSPAAAQRARDAAAEAFVAAQSQRALAILNDRSLSPAAKQAQFRTFVNQVVDVPRITTLVLGKYARAITPAQRTQFAQVFREYASNVYENRLDDYRGERFQVTGSTVSRPGQAVVSSLISGGQLRRPEVVQWRLQRVGQSWRVVDVNVRGVWLAVAQQSDFTSTVDNAGGRVEVLINQLRRQVAQQERRG